MFQAHRAVGVIAAFGLVHIISACGSNIEPQQGGANGGRSTEVADDAACIGVPELPEGVEEQLCSDFPEGARELKAGPSGAALILPPSQNIWCSVSEDTLDCTMIDPITRINLGTEGQAIVANRDDGPVAELPFTLEYGHTATFSAFVCLSEEVGLSCRNTDTKHGLFLSRDEVFRW